MYKEDIELAKQSMNYSYSPYSNYQVGCVLRTKDDKLYSGCNVENNGIQSICAERVAFVKALSEGEKNFKCITIVGAKKGEEISRECLPCGYCRQFINEFVDKNFKIYTFDGSNVKEYGIDDLLPYDFNF